MPKPIIISDPFPRTLKLILDKNLFSTLNQENGSYNGLKKKKPFIPKNLYPTEKMFLIKNECMCKGKIRISGSFSPKKLHFKKY